MYNGLNSTEAKLLVGQYACATGLQILRGSSEFVLRASFFEVSVLVFSDIGIKYTK